MSVARELITSMSFQAVKARPNYASTPPPYWLHGRLKLTANAFNRLTTSPGCTAYYYAELAFSSPVVTKTIVSTHCTDPEGRPSSVACKITA